MGGNDELLLALEAPIRQRQSEHDYSKATALMLELYGERIRRFLAAQTREPNIAEEAYSDFAYDVWRGMPGFRWECSARSWAFTLAKHAMLRAAKKRRLRRRREQLVSHAELDGGFAQQPASERRRADRTTSRLRVERCCRELPLADQTLLSLRVRRRLNWKAIAQLMSVERIAALGPSAVDSEAARLRKRFQLVKARLRLLAAADALQSGKGDTASR
jgi:RNA polymerase sigma-70 factor (ECF subfamily)